MRTERRTPRTSAWTHPRAAELAARFGAHSVCVAFRSVRAARRTSAPVAAGERRPSGRRAAGGTEATFGWRELATRTAAERRRTAARTAALARMRAMPRSHPLALEFAPRTHAPGMFVGAAAVARHGVRGVVGPGGSVRRYTARGGEQAGEQQSRGRLHGSSKPYQRCGRAVAPWDRWCAYTFGNRSFGTLKVAR